LGRGANPTGVSGQQEGTQIHAKCGILYPKSDSEWAWTVHCTFHGLQSLIIFRPYIRVHDHNRGTWCPF